MKRLLVLITFLSLSFASYSQYWQKTYPYNSAVPCKSQIIDLQQTADGGYIALENIIRNLNLPYPGIPDTTSSLLKTDANGQLQWRKPIFPTANTLQQGISVVQTPDLGYLVSGVEYNQHTIISGSIFIHFAMKVDMNGDSLWRQSLDTVVYGVTDFNYLNAVVSTDGNYVLSTSSFDISNFSSDSTIVQKVTPQGNLIWKKSYSFVESARVSAMPGNDIMLATVKDDFSTGLLVRINEQGVVTGSSVVNDYWPYVHKMESTGSSNGVFLLRKWVSSKAEIVKYDVSGNIDWEYQHPGPNSFSNYCTDLSLVGDSSTILFINDNGIEHTAVLLDTSGNLIWTKSITDNNVSWADDEVSTVTSGLSGNSVFGGRYFGQSTIWNINAQSYVFTNQVNGQVFYDFNNNCLSDNNETSLANWVVEAEQNGFHYYSLTDSLGNYSMNVDTGNITVSITPPFNNYLWQPCSGSQNFTFATLLDTVTVDFGIQTNSLCPVMNVDVSTPILRQCCTNTYTVNYCNTGAQNATNAYVEVDIDPALIVTNSSIPWTTVTGNTYTFPIGTVNISDCGQFTISAIFDTTTTITLGQTHCTEAHIYPDSTCAVPNNWSGANVRTSGECLGNSILFKIYNIGTVDMPQNRTYFVIEDDIIMLQGTFNLLQGDSLAIPVTTNGSTYRLVAQQENNHPFSQFSTVAFEGCTTNSNFSTGFVNIFPNNNGAPYSSIECIQNIGSYDPNDKQALPKGWGVPNYVLANTEIDYKIRFQNTGTDTAFTIVVRDTIDTDLLDINTIEFGASSHNYQAQILGNGVVKFTFANIMLPDSNVNEATSHGFLKFKIQQKLNNPLGSEIKNTAAIYFDYNPPIITNTVLRTIGQMALLVKTNEPLAVEERMSKVSVFPNPFLEQAVFRFDDNESRDVHFMVFDVTGRMVFEENYQSVNQFDFNRQNMTSGLYFYVIKSNGKTINKGKIIAQ